MMTMLPITLIALTIITCQPGVDALTNSKTCQTLELIRNYAEADGLYELSSQTCPHNNMTRYYRRTVAYEESRSDSESPYYFYPLPTGHWAVYINDCSSVHYGITSNATSYPWTQRFEESDVSSITCIDYSEEVSHSAYAEGDTFTFPTTYPHLMTYKYTIEMPSSAESITFDTELTDMNGTNGTCSIGGIEISFLTGDTDTIPLLYGDFCQDPDNFADLQIKLDSSNSSRIIIVQVNYSAILSDEVRPDVGELPQLTISYTVRPVLDPPETTTASDDDPLTTTTYDDPQETTTAGDDTSEPEGSGEIYYTTRGPEDRESSGVEDLDSSGDLDTSSAPISSTSETTVIEQDVLCIGVRCHFGAACIFGECECPKPSECGEELDPYCAGSSSIQHNFKNKCLLKIGICQNRKAFAVTKKGECMVVAPTVSVFHGEILQGDDANDLLTIILVVCFVGILAIIAITAIACYYKRKKRTNVFVVNGPQVKVEPRPKEKEKTRTPSRTYSSRSSSFRASPKPRHHMMTIEVNTDKLKDDDRFSLSGCITPIHDMPENPFETFKPTEIKKDSNDQPQNGVVKRDNPPQRNLSATENSVIELKMDGDSGIVEAPELLNDTPVKTESPKLTEQPENVVRRSNPPRRNTSTTENSVYELQPEAFGDSIIELEVFESEIQEDPKATTRV